MKLLLIYNMISFSCYENEIMKLARILMDLERIVLGKAIEIQKEKPYMFSLTHGP